MRSHTRCGETLTLVAVAAVLVASVRLHFLDMVVKARQPGTRVFACDAQVAKGCELGWFEHGSTIIVLAPPGFVFCDNVAEGARIRTGEPLLRRAG